MKIYYNKNFYKNQLFLFSYTCFKNDTKYNKGKELSF